MGRGFRRPAGEDVWEAINPYFRGQRNYYSYPKSEAVGHMSRFYISTHYPFKAKLFNEHLASSGEHRWNVVDKKGEMVFAGMMTMGAAYEIEETLNMRAAQQLMTED